LQHLFFLAVLFLFCAVACSFDAPAHLSTPDARLPPLAGGFIQFTGEVLEELHPKDWYAVLGELKALGMKTVIIQRLGVAKDAGASPPPFLFEKYGKNDPTPIILDCAGKLNLDVYLGLVSPPDENNAQIGFWKPQNLSTFSNANCAFAKKVGEKYRGFKGWYIPLENWVGEYPPKDSDKGQEFPDAWRQFYADVTSACKRSQQLPVAISPCLPVKSYSIDDAEKAAMIYESMLTGTQLDIVMLQDSVGAKPETWSPTQAAAYLAPLKKVCTKHGMQLWSNIESFETNGSGWIPCLFERLDEQISATKNADRRVTFDFLHYMNGRVHLSSWSEKYVGRMQKLHDKYKAKYVN
jgi:hypothetical protein